MFYLSNDDFAGQARTGRVGGGGVSHAVIHHGQIGFASAVTQRVVERGAERLAGGCISRKVMLCWTFHGGSNCLDLQVVSIMFGEQGEGRDGTWGVRFSQF